MARTKVFTDLSVYSFSLSPDVVKALEHYGNNRSEALRNLFDAAQYEIVPTQGKQDDGLDFEAGYAAGYAAAKEEQVTEEILTFKPVLFTAEEIEQNTNDRSTELRIRVNPAIKAAFGRLRTGLEYANNADLFHYMLTLLSNA